MKERARHVLGNVFRPNRFLWPFHMFLGASGVAKEPFETKKIQTLQTSCKTIFGY